MASTQSQLTKFDSVRWGKANLTLTQLLKKYPLPQIVKVVKGYYGEDSNSTLCNGSILCLESIKSIQRVHGRLSWGKGREIFIPLDCRSKVEVRPSNLKDVYESVEELCSVFPAYVRVSQGYYSLSSGEALLSFGDKLQLKGVDKSLKKEKKLVCFNQCGKKVVLSKETRAAFQPLADGKEYYLSDVLRKFPLPLTVQFVEPYRVDENTRSANKPPFQPFRTICLDRVSTETFIIATSIDANGEHEAEISPKADVTLVVCKNYTNYVQIFSQRNFDQNAQSSQSYKYIDDDRIKSMISANRSFWQNPKTINFTSTSSDLNVAGLNECSEIQGVSNDTGNATFGPTYTSNQENVTPFKEKLTQKSETQPGVPNLPQDSVALPVTQAFELSNSANNKLRTANEECKKSAVEQLTTEGSENQAPINANRPHLPPNAIALPVRLVRRLSDPIHEESYVSNQDFPKPTSDPFNRSSEYQPPIRDNTNLPKSEPDRTGKRERLSLSPNAHHHQPQRTPKYLTSSFDSPSSTQISRHSAATPGEDREEIYQAIARYPADLSGLSVAGVSRLLKDLGMENLVEIFAKELIDGPMLASMDKESLQSLDLSSFHIIKLLRFIGGWRPKVAHKSTPC